MDEKIDLDHMVGLYVVLRIWADFPFIQIQGTLRKHDNELYKIDDLGFALFREQDVSRMDTEGRVIYLKATIK